MLRVEVLKQAGEASGATLASPFVADRGMVIRGMGQSVRTSEAYSYPILKSVQN
jgi:hypothetical protein